MQTAGLLKLSSKSLLSLEVIASGIWWWARVVRGAGSLASLSAAEGMGSASRWGQLLSLALNPRKRRSSWGRVAQASWGRGWRMLGVNAGLGFLCSRGCGCVACRGPLPGEVSLFLQVSWLLLSLFPLIWPAFPVLL